MTSPSRTASARMRIQHEAPDQEIFKSALALLERKQTASGGSQGELIAAARYLARAVTIYSKSVKECLPDVKINHEEPARLCEDEAAKQRKLAHSLIESLNHPACKYSTLPPADDHALVELLRKLADDEPDIAAARERRAEVRQQPPAAKTNRHRLCHAIGHAWLIATGQEKTPSRQKNAEQDPCGEFHDFVKSALKLTKETNHISPDELHRDIISHKPA